MATQFESEVCGRCAGSGQYSYNQIDGSKCYGCMGRKMRYTKRGQAAVDFLHAMRKVSIDSLQVGDIMEVDSLTFRYFARIVEIKEVDGGKSRDFSTGELIQQPNALSVVTDHQKYGRTGITAPKGYMVRKGFSKTEKADQVRKALEFQDSLTKAGIPRKA